MIQELLGGVVEERKIPTSSSPSQSATSSPSSSAAAEIAQNHQNLRCPRCDSSNTKFCYYNNYNLTQPRHFCKTCRRYWTKGGALRNVPIGGGCRKARSCSAAVAGVPATKNGKPRQMASLCQLAEPCGSPVLWAAGLPQGSHLLALLRASQLQNANPNPNPNPSFLNSSFRIKDEGAMVDANGLGSLDHLGLPVGPFGSYPFQYSQQQQQNLLLSDVPTSSGIQELYQRLRASTGGYNCNGSDNLQMINGNNVGCGNSCSSSAAAAAAAASTTMATITTTASILEPIPLSVGDFGYWNPAMSWATDLSSANGAFP